jgi:hypothetical protein
MRVLSGITGNIRTAINLQERGIPALQEGRDETDWQQNRPGKGWGVRVPYKNTGIGYREAVSDAGAAS